MKRKWLILFIIIVLTVPFLHWQNNGITITRHEYVNDQFPSQFDGFKVVQISDLHNKAFGKHQSRLISKIEAESPDAIFMTGDLIDSRHPQVEIAIQFIKKAVQIAPVYYVTGNHEQRVLTEYGTLKAQMTALGVFVLENATVNLNKNGETLMIVGVNDPEFQKSPYEQDGENAAISTYLETINLETINLEITNLNTTNINTTNINIANIGQKSFKILLSHRPELFNLYTEHKIDVVFSGHAHGGQFRLPFVGGFIAPNQGFFPKLTSGEYKDEETTLFVSRGLGNSIIPQRLFNRPEIVVVTFKSN